MKNMNEIKSELGFAALNTDGSEEHDIKDLNEMPWDRENIVMQYKTHIVYADKFPVTEGHLLYVPRSRNFLQIMDCFTEAYKRGISGIENKEWDGFNIGMNFNEQAGQTIDWPHVHLIPRREGDTEEPRGGIRNVIPGAGDYK